MQVIRVRAMRKLARAYFPGNPTPRRVTAKDRIHLDPKEWRGAPVIVNAAGAAQRWPSHRRRYFGGVLKGSAMRGALRGPL